MTPQRTFVRFVAVGGFAALVNFLARMALQHLSTFEWAVVGAYFLGMSVAFVLNRALVFAIDGDWRHQYLRFALINLVALIQVFVVSVGLARFVFPSIGLAWHAQAVAHAIGLASPIVTSYWGHKHFSFSQARPGPTA